MGATLLYSAILIIVVLLMVAGYYLFRVYRLQKSLKTQRAEALAAEAEHKEYLQSSVVIICRAVLAGQVGYVEASIRLSGLMDQLGYTEKEREGFAVFDKMSQAVSHIPKLEDWKKLPRSAKQSFEKEMQQYESELGDFIEDAARKMLAQKQPI